MGGRSSREDGVLRTSSRESSTAVGVRLPA